jgi:Tol biopolymer transport system component
MPSLPFPLLPLLAAVSALPPAFAQVQQLTPLSVAPSGAFGDSDSGGPSVSSDGRWAVFRSAARNLVGAETNLDADIFAVDLWDGDLRRISSAPGGAEGNADSYRAQISSNGRFVAFASLATNLTSPGGNGAPQIYLHALDNGLTTLVSVDVAGLAGDGASEWADVSDDGRFVAFASDAGDLVPGDTNLQEDVFVRDMLLGQTTRVSVDALGQQASWPSGPFGPATCAQADLSPDGRFVVFTTLFALLPADTNSAHDVYLVDRSNGALELLSRAPGFVLGNAASTSGQISADGRFAVFASDASNFASGDVNAARDVFVRDRVLDTLVCASRAPAGAPAGVSGSWDTPPRIAADGSFAIFHSPSTALAPGDTNPLDDVFVYTLATGALELVRPLGLTPNGAVYDAALSNGGATLLFTTAASNLAAGDTNNRFDVFALERDACKPTSYCTSGVSAGGCSAVLTAGGAASLSSCTLALSATGVDGQRQGLIFYGTSGAVALPWGAGSSFMCVKSPVQRTALQNSGGAIGSCSGGFALNWCAFLAANPNALGAPFVAGDALYAQAWYRDPASPKTTALTNGVRVEVCP